MAASTASINLHPLNLTPTYTKLQADQQHCLKLPSLHVPPPHCSLKSVFGPVEPASRPWRRVLKVSETLGQVEAQQAADQTAASAENEADQAAGSAETEKTDQTAESAETPEGDRTAENAETPEGDQTPASAVNTKLYFGNLPYSVDSATLAGIIQEYGSPELIEVLYDRNTGKSRGFAFVTMSSVEDCNAVIENLDGSEFLGRCLRVNFSDKPKPREPLYPETEHKLFIGNLSWSVTSESLTRAFQEYGNVVGARVIYDGETGKSRGYGFVCYSTRTEMETALHALDGVELEGRAMRVSLAQGKKSS